MPAFDDKLKPEEIKAVSVYAFSAAAVSAVRPDTARARRSSNPTPNNPKAMPRPATR
jgi:hypothetical protein